MTSACRHRWNWSVSLRLIYTAAIVLFAAIAGPSTAVGQAESAPNWQKLCSNGVSVPHPNANPDLIRDCATLLSIRETLAGGATLEWAAQTAMEHWEGVTISGSPRRVSQLKIKRDPPIEEAQTDEKGRQIVVIKLDTDSRLRGAIPPALASLDGLETLDLSRNSLKGEIPPELGKLKALKSLNLSYNQLSGAIPPELGNMDNLETLTLEVNYLDGEIPPSLGDLLKLRELNLSFNSLTGSIPEELGRLDKLTLISLDQSDLIGKIPEQLINLTNLTTLKVDGRYLGPVPAWIAKLHKLEVLKLSPMEGPIPPSIGDLSKLREFHFVGDSFSGSGSASGIPHEIGRLSELEVLTLWVVEGPIPPSIGDLTKLRKLHLSGHKLTEGIPSEFGGLSELRELFISGTGISGQIPPELGNLRNLKHLSISETAIHGPLPPELGNLTKLESLSLDHNYLVGQIPAELANLRRLESLNLSWNDLTGPIPPELSLFTNLWSLDLSVNELSGNIPRSLGSLQDLRYLDLSANQLSGNIPFSLGSLQDLGRLDLGGNQLSGPIPPELGNLKVMRALFLGGNQLSGSIPRELGNLLSLERLTLSSNRLSGKVPVEFDNLSELTLLYLGENDLSGCIPSTLRRDHAMWTPKDFPFCEDKNRPALGDIRSEIALEPINANQETVITMSDERVRLTIPPVELVDPVQAFIFVDPAHCVDAKSPVHLLVACAKLSAMTEAGHEYTPVHGITVDISTHILFDNWEVATDDLVREDATDSLGVLIRSAQHPLWEPLEFELTTSPGEPLTVTIESVSLLSTIAVVIDSASFNRLQRNPRATRLQPLFIAALPTGSVRIE